MKDSSVLLEEIAQEEADKAAFRRLTKFQKRLSWFLASIGFTGRQGIVGIAGIVIAVLEILVNYLLFWPYRKIWECLLWLADGLADVAKFPITGFVLMVTGFVAVALAILDQITRALTWLEAHGITGGVTVLAWLKRLSVAREFLIVLARQVREWGSRVKLAIDAAWERMKAFAQALLHRTWEFIEYYGAISLFRLAKWILNPRTPSGLPFLVSERLNTLFGIVLAAIAFVILSSFLTAVGVWAKFMHARLVESFMMDSGPIEWKLAKQALYHPLITISLTSVKFVLLPIIAAARQALKSTDFTRGVAHAYSMQVKRNKIRGNASKDSADKGPKIMGVISKFIVHLVDKSSPNYYEGRLRYYRSRAAVFGSAG